MCGTGTKIWSFTGTKPVPGMQEKKVTGSEIREKIVQSETKEFSIILSELSHKSHWSKQNSVGVIEKSDVLSTE